MSFKLLILVTALSSSGPYFNQEPPRLEAKLFAPGIISSGLHEDGGLIITPDEKEMFVRIVQEPLGYTAHYILKNGNWSSPKVAPFSGKYQDGRMAAHPDGKRLFISSPSPIDSQGPPKDYDFWIVNKTETGWGEPKLIQGPINTKYDEIDLSFAQNGNLYFNRQGGADHMDIFMAREVDGKFLVPEKLLIPGYQAFWEVAPMVAPDGSYIVFTSEGRPNSVGDLDLFVTFKLVDGTWSEPQNLGNKVNSPQSDKLSTLSPDGKYMFWISDRTSVKNWSEERLTIEQLQKSYESFGNGKGDMYWVSTEVIEALRP
ncbi:MAG: hypothetical protein HOH19_14715 [Kordiimonadaceae bacterium]|jgi:hypothetical protein|nr:hypothetical protein [Kordiimonadaceae bacterium]MBT6033823.1 hypothetical protein [Kordiimonadaceae bacterium]